MTSYYIEPHYFDLAEANGIARSTLERRVYDLAWEVERAATELPRKTLSRKEWATIAEQNGIKYGTFINRINVGGWSEKRAATEPTVKAAEAGKRAGKSKKYTKLTDEVVELAKSNGIGYNTLQSRVYTRKWDVLRAATEPVKTRNECMHEAREAFKKYHGHYWHEENKLFFQ